MTDTATELAPGAFGLGGFIGGLGVAFDFVESVIGEPEDGGAEGLIHCFGAGYQLQRVAIQAGGGFQVKETLACEHCRYHVAEDRGQEAEASGGEGERADIALQHQVIGAV